MLRNLLDPCYGCAATPQPYSPTALRLLVIPLTGPHLGDVDGGSVVVGHDGQRVTAEAGAAGLRVGVLRGAHGIEVEVLHAATWRSWGDRRGLHMSVGGNIICESEAVKGGGGGGEPRYGVRRQAARLGLHWSYLNLMNSSTRAGMKTSGLTDT